MPRQIAYALPSMLVLFAFSSVSRCDTKQPVVFPTFGISYTAPLDATFELTDSFTNIGIYQFNASAPNAGAAILLEVAPAHGKTLDETSSSIAKSMSATVDSGSIIVGGEKARKLTADFHAAPFKTRVTCIVVHQDRLYVASALNLPKSSAARSLDDLLATVQFIAVESPVKNTKDFFEKPFDVFGRFTMNGPKFLRRRDNQPTLLHLEAHDYTTKSNPLNIDIQRVQIPTPKSFADLQAAYSDGLQKGLDSQEKLVWSVVKKVPGLHVSNPVKKGSVKLPDGSQEAQTFRYCILELAPGDFVQILFSVPTLPDADLKAYVDLSDRMLETIAILSPPNQAKP